MTVYQVHADTEGVSFTRWLADNLLLDWKKILDDMNDINFTAEEDVIVWKFGHLSTFSVKSMYNAMAINDSGPYHKKIWKGKVPAKIKIFLWLMMNNAILTKDNLLKRKWVGDPSCHFCDNDETISHLFFQCSTAKAVWAIAAKSIGANNVPRSLGQCWIWCEK